MGAEANVGVPVRSFQTLETRPVGFGQGRVREGSTQAWVVMADLDTLNLTVIRHTDTSVRSDACGSLLSPLGGQCVLGQQLSSNHPDAEESRERRPARRNMTSCLHRAHVSLTLTTILGCAEVTTSP
jgi:hypothetical protein